MYEMSALMPKLLIPKIHFNTAFQSLEKYDADLPFQSNTLYCSEQKSTEAVSLHCSQFVTLFAMFQLFN